MSHLFLRCWLAGLMILAFGLLGCPVDPPADDDDTSVGDDDDTGAADDDDSAGDDDDDTSVGDDDTSVGDDDDTGVGDDDDTSVGDDDDTSVPDDDDSAADDDDSAADDDDSAGDDDDSAAVISACADGIDNDADSWTDLDDPGCNDADDNSEYNDASTAECNDGLDNDADGDIDALDTACDDATDDLEAGLRVGDLSWDDANSDGLWVYPEALTVSATLYNESSESFVTAVGAQFSVDPALFLLTPSQSWLGSLPAGGSGALGFNATFLGSYPGGTVVTFTIDPSTPTCASAGVGCPDPNPYSLSITLN